MQVSLPTSRRTSSLLDMVFSVVGEASLGVDEGNRKSLEWPGQRSGGSAQRKLPARRETQRTKVNEAQVRLAGGFLQIAPNVETSVFVVVKVTRTHRRSRRVGGSIDAIVKSDERVL